jgi:signal transduction histidine kinase
VRILLVDDDEVDRLAVRRVFRASSLTVDIKEAHEGRAALAALLGERFDCVLLDYLLPGVDGLEFLRKIRAAGVDTPVVMLTGHGNEQIAVDLMKAGASDYLVKGALSPERLALSVQRAIERKQLEDERKRLLAREQDARLEAEAANRAKDQFLSMVSHELRTPLHAILGWARLLRTGQSDAAAVAHALEVIERNALAQTRLIDELLDVSRIVSGALTIEVGPVELLQMVEAAVDTVRPAAEAKEIHLDVEVDRAAGAIVGDGNRLQQVVCNLVSNAIKFSPKNGRVGLTLRRTGASIEIKVSDAGRGIGPEFLPHVFERFRQEEGAGSSPGGLGLGLAIVRHLVELHGGRVRAESPGEGQGATFIVELPVETPAAPETTAS